MLVLTRKLGESIDIDGGTVTITVLEVRSGQIKLGLVAPPNVTVHRAEIARRIIEAGEDPRVRQRGRRPGPVLPVTRRRDLWGSAAAELAARPLHQRRQDEATADAEEARQRELERTREAAPKALKGRAS